MFLLYADDSGSAGDASQSFFVLGGVALFERQPHWIAQELEKIAARFNPADSQSVELHGSPMLKGRGFWRNVPAQDRVQAICDSLKIFALSPTDNRAFGMAINKAAVAPRDPVEVAFEELCKRFDHYLMRMHKAGNTQRGLIVFDKSTRETTIQRLATDYRTVGHSSGLVRNLSEVPVFVDSRASRLVQLADLIAYSIFLKHERGDCRFFDIFQHRFDSHGGQVHGLHVVT